jgi:hypothetical protein
MSSNIYRILEYAREEMHSVLIQKISSQEANW